MMMSQKRIQNNFRGYSPSPRPGKAARGFFVAGKNLSYIRGMDTLLEDIPYKTRTFADAATAR
jgi:hypothetical protein